MYEVTITSINPGDPDYALEEFVVLENNSAQGIFLDNWRLVWQEWPSQRKLHEYRFINWYGRRIFNCQEKIFLISGVGPDNFYHTGQKKFCPKAHTVLFTNTQKHICSVPYIKVTLYDDKNMEVDHLFSNQFRNSPSSQPVIVIGHGQNPAWEELCNHLRDKQKFEVEAFETASRTSKTIPDVIADLGSSANMAILVMTGEDEMADGSIYPRLNVVQELGKFQERFGYNKTIILKENGVTIPSNNSGIIYIPFEAGNIRSSFGDVVAAIRDEFKL